MASKRAIFSSILGAVAIAFPVAGQNPPSPDELARIEAAVPEKPCAVPKKQRRMLIISQCEGFVHSSIPYVEKAFEIMGRKSGAFETTVVPDMSILETPEFDTFDAIVMNNTTMRLPLLNIDTQNMAEEQKQQAEARETKAQKRFLDFVHNGKGIIGVHAATDCLYKWPEYGELMGGFFSGHPWSETVAIKLDDPGHPLLRAFNGQGFEVNDEIYQFREPYSREKLRVLLTLDVPRIDMTKKGIKREDKDFAVAWIHEYGQGRVFYFSLGHRHEIMWNAPIMQCYLDGIQYALGDLEADATPSAELSEDYLARSRALGIAQGQVKIFAALTNYRFGENDTVARQIERMVIDYQAGTNQEVCDELSRRLAEVAANPTATEDARTFACRQLELVGRENAVQSLASLLADETMSDRARSALECIPGDTVNQVLTDALSKTSGKLCAGIADSLGQRQVREAVDALILVLKRNDLPAAVGAAGTLGRIAGKDALGALIERRKTAQGALSDAVNQGILACGEAARASGDMAVAERAYTQLLDADTAIPEHIRAAAFYGLAMIRGDLGVTDAIEALKGNSVEMIRAGARLVSDLSSDTCVPRVAAQLASMPPASQALVLDALARRSDVRAEDAALTLIGADEPVALAALGCLQTVGTGKVVMPVIATAADKAAPQSVRDAARRTLTLMKGANVDQVLIDAIPNADTTKKTEYVIALGERKAVSALPTLFQTARDSDRELRKESCKAIGLLATTPDLPEIVKLLTETTNSTTRGQLENILVSVARRTSDPALKTGAILEAIGKDINRDAFGAFITALGEIGDPRGLETILNALKSTDDETRKTAIKALADNWPDAVPIEALRAISLNADNQVHRILALRGYARMLAMPSDRPMKETLALYREALDLAKGEQEKRTLIGGLGQLAHPDALEFVRPYLNDPAVQAEALLAAVSISQNLDGAAMSFNASAGHGTEKNAIDGSPKTRWTSGKVMQGGEWFQIDLGYETDIREIYLDAGPEGHDQPRGYEVYVSRDGETWGNPVITGPDPNERAFTIALNPPVYGRCIKIVQTGRSGYYWSINEIRINGRPETTGKAKLDRSKWKVSASRSAKDSPPENAIDGDLNKRWGSGSGMKPDDWFLIDLGEEKTVYRLIMDAAKSGSDYPREFKIYTSLDGKEWFGPIGSGTGNSALVTAVLLPTKARFVKIAQTGEHEKYWWSIYNIDIIGE